jgi:ABC-type sugar transport system ATPase subunit
MTSPADTGGTGGSQEPPVLAVEHLSKTFPGTRALSDVDLTIGTGEVHALIGANGSGKSTLIKILAGYYAGDPGAYAAVNGESIPLNRTADHRHQKLRFVHQDGGVIRGLSVLDNLALAGGYPTRMRLINWRAHRRMARELLRRFDLHIDLDRPLEAATPVQRVVVAIAAALQNWEGGRALLVLDEPTAVLPVNEVRALFDVIASVKQQGASVLYVSHRMDELFTVADVASVLRGGRRVATRPMASLTTSEIADLMTGHSVEAAQRTTGPGARQKGTALIEGRGVSGRYLRGIDFSIGAGEIVGVAGLPGSGREELPYIVSGSFRPGEVAGEITVHAESGAKTVDLARRPGSYHGFPIVPADRINEAIFGPWTVGENLSVRVLDQVSQGPFVRRGQEQSVVDDWLKRLDVRSEGRHAGIGTLSGGNQQKVVLARCLIERAPLLVMCEPTAGVDIAARYSLYRLVMSEAERGLGVLVSSTDHGDLTALCDRVIVLDRGKVMTVLEGNEVSDRALIEAMEGTEAMV